MNTSLSNYDPLWIYPAEDPVWHKKIISEFSIHPVTAQILVSRNFSSLHEINNYLYGKLPNLYSPDLFRDMNKAIKRIYDALKNNEGILIYGDNDVDGMTAAALLCDFFKEIGANVYFFIPNPNIQKKGIIEDALEFALKHQCSLIITVDCGITAAKEIQNVLQHNIDVIITDHHEPTSKIPHCIATLNPKLINSSYPNRALTGVGVAFKLAHALTNFFNQEGLINKTFIDLKNYLDLAALGTVADMGSLLGENRILVRYGLQQMQQNPRIGLSKLFAICDVNYKDLTPLDIAAKVAPRLNSLGRIDDPRKGVELLLCKDELEATRLACELDLNNTERQKIEKKASDDIETYLSLNPKILNNFAIVLYSDKWHSGIIPIITAKICKTFNRPTMIIAIEEGIGKGSIRTIAEFPLLTILKENRDLLLNFGGHDYAAGLTIEEKNIPQLKQKFIEAANSILKKEDIIPKLFLDAHVRFDDLTFDFMESLNLLEPYGTDNFPPILYCDVKQTWPPKIVGKNHLKFYLEQNERVLEGIGFNMAHRKSALKKKNLSLRIAFTPHVNTFLNKSSIQLQIKDFKILE